MTAPAPTACPTCKGEGKLRGGPFWWYCPDCRCDVCGKTTPTPPLCRDCSDDLGDEAYERSHQ